MAHNINSRAISPADQLRRDLDDAEKLVTRIAPEQVETLLLTLDRIDGAFDRLTNSGMDLRPEQSRWDSLIQRVNSRGGGHCQGGGQGFRAFLVCAKPTPSARPAR